MALVTGGTRGIGAATCRALADEGAHLAAGYWRDDEDVEKFLTAMAADDQGRRITVHEGNIGSADDCRRVLREVIDQHGRVDILVNNAGITIDRTVAKMTDEDWHKVIAVNLSLVGDRSAPRSATTRAARSSSSPRKTAGSTGPEHRGRTRPPGCLIALIALPSRNRSAGVPAAEDALGDGRRADDGEQPQPYR